MAFSLLSGHNRRSAHVFARVSRTSLSSRPPEPRRASSTTKPSWFGNVAPVSAATTLRFGRPPAMPDSVATIRIVHQSEAPTLAHVASLNGHFRPLVPHCRTCPQRPSGAAGRGGPPSGAAAASAVAAAAVAGWRGAAEGGGGGQGSRTAAHTGTGGIGGAWRVAAARRGWGPTRRCHVCARGAQLS